MKLTDKLSQGPWNKQLYYDNARKASLNIHPSLEKLLHRYKNKSVLEIACGDGTKLTLIDAKTRTGLDVSKLAIKIAKKKLDTAVVGNAEKLPFPDSKFDAVFSFFSMEHFENPEKVINEMVRVLKKNGELAIITPNFGSPNRSSPCFKGSRLSKLITGLIRDFTHQSSSSLNWNYVEPLSLHESHKQDFDTTVEPYLRTLNKYLVARGLTIIEYSSNWQVIVGKENILQQIFHFLGSLNIYPFKYWGPHAFTLVKKI